MPNDDHTESLRAAERRLQAAQLTSDVDALAELIDDEARFTGPDGNRTWIHDQSGWKIIAAHATFRTDELLDIGDGNAG
ncbi:MAG: DUF4440 domain-containing protein [Actinophytocola sp.]|uniref:nuclear transport factor 2 family protein n=1 Tax=Actinophytocola sp. TaxID=1872138 RepID=UPI0013271BD0|nr:nuclear transport factor 2 family protein [Actinophytocola sp.]MPZ83095.1 DUF4440 domain-containing protein [Actinophytocola sp.]